MNKEVFDIAVIGGGVIGLVTTRQLYKQGLKVAIIEKNAQVAMEASRAGGGIISPLHPWRYSKAMLDLASWSHLRYPNLAHELSVETGVPVPIIKTGMLIPNIEEVDAALNCSFLSAKKLSAQQVFDYEPGLQNPSESVWVEDVHNIRNPVLCNALAAYVENSSIEVKVSTTITSVNKKKGVFELSSEQGILRAHKVAICAGAWSSQLIGLFSHLQSELELDKLPEIFPVKGQMIAYKAKLGVLRSVVLEKNRYLIPRHDGVIIVGSSVENKEFDKSLTQDVYKDLVSFAEAKIPALKHYPVISHWAGLRPGSRRDHPIISKLQGVDGVYLSIGHFRNGLLSAPASAQVLTDIVLEQKSDFDISAYAI